MSLYYLRSFLWSANLHALSNWSKLEKFRVGLFKQWLVGLSTCKNILQLTVVLKTELNFSSMYIFYGYTELVPRVSSPGSSSGRGHCVVFLGKTINPHSASLRPLAGGYIGTSELFGKLNKSQGVTCNGLVSHPGEVEIHVLLAASCYRNWDKLQQLWASQLPGFTLLWPNWAVDM